MNNPKIILITDSLIIRKGLADFLIEQFDQIEIIKDINQLDYLLPALNAMFNYIFITDSGYAVTIEHLYSKNTQNLLILPIVNSKKTKDRKPNEIVIYDDKKSIIETVQRAANQLVAQNQSSKPTKELSEREKSVLQLVVKGFSSKSIADRLFISVQTVSVHRKNITQKLGIKTVAGLTLYAVINQLILPEETSLN